MKFQLGAFATGRTTILPVFVGQKGEQFGLNLTDYHGKKKDHVVWFDKDGTRFVVVGLGEQKNFHLNKLRDAMAFGARAAVKEGATEVTALVPTLEGFTTEQLVHTSVEGYKLGEYRFDKYKKSKETITVETVTLAGFDGALSGVEGAIKTGEIYAEGTIIARNLKNEPSNKMKPFVLADFVQDLFKDSKNTSIEVFKGDALQDKKFVGLIEVGKGSVNPPAMIKVTYQGDASKPLTALVGKGLTFDTGGISLKVGVRDLSNMRMDMGGSAAVIGALYILTRLEAPVNVVMLVASAESMPDAAAFLPGDVIEYPNGVSVHVGNTDAEGRLVLADALIYSKELGAERVVDIATLTGACAAALGNKLAGLFGEESVVEGIKASAKVTGENVWELPLWDDYEELLYSPIGDIRNITEGPGALTAALFLRRFVGENQKWAHIDMAGPMDGAKTHTYSNEGATGFGARLLADWVLR
ncbi:leucyl aminopeptidase family protein [Tumebacillus sp. ITR2]|uniref:Probable cytosol aminopeptidase n=1 Tax=Tumebacillus amylolyticus TaxID=2801339 RepID=A0ABS1JC99_9BACL|nr:leucyl aminopeptidase family protein [Tumebacillus amylolyticus]MBL0387664.1 leucyl aminopeptidase family protein [Tumebacillus amylolyticus]